MQSYEHVKATRWLVGVGIIAFILLSAGTMLALPAGWYLEGGWNAQNASDISYYFDTLFIQPRYWAKVYGEWLLSGSAMLPYMPLVFAAAAVMIGAAVNPHRMGSTLHGSARYADQQDVKKMGLLKGSMFILGKWRGKKLQLPETLSALCLAPPGTGKTAAVVIPSILSAGHCSLIINDVKPELAELTSGHRAKISRVFILSWAAQDNPQKGIYHPRWNPLSPKNIPASESQRELYIDRLCHILIESKADSGGNMEYFQNKARALLAGLLLFMVERGRGEVAEPSIPMLQDWIAEQMGNGDGDPVEVMLRVAIAEAKQHEYGRRIINELTEVLAVPDKERGSVLSTVNEALAVFKNGAVRERTSASDFTFADFRGVADGKGGWQPVTLYLCANQQDARTLGKITALFCEAASAYLIANKPGITDEEGRQLGDCPVAFILDEFPQMPKLQALLDGPAVGRGQKVSYLMIGQDFGQIEQKYGASGVETLISTTAAKIVLPLNNEKTAARFAAMVGKTTVTTTSKSQQTGDVFKANTSKQETGMDLVKTEEFLSMPEGKHIVLYQKYMNRPILADTPFYFKDRQWKNDVATLTAECLPEDVVNQRILEELMLKKFLMTGVLGMATLIGGINAQAMAAKPAANGNVQYPPYPEVWGYDLSSQLADDAKDPTLWVDRMPNGDIYVSVGLDEEFNKVLQVKFFAGDVKVLSQSEYQTFMTNNLDRVSLSTETGKVTFHDGTEYDLDTYSSFDGNPLNEYISVRDKTGKERSKLSVVAVLDKPMQGEYYGDGEMHPFTYQVEQKIHTLIPLKDDTFLTYIDGHLIRLRKDFSTDYIDAPELTVMDERVLQKVIGDVDGDIMEQQPKLKFHLLNVVKPIDQKLKQHHKMQQGG